MSIGEFARRSRPSPKALRLYDGLGLLSPGRVDELSGYRCYAGAQLGQAWLIAALRQVGVPLTTVKELLVCGAVTRSRVLATSCPDRAMVVPRGDPQYASFRWCQPGDAARY
jgi:DNA-binding transcriptional MerR regulator